MSGVSVVNKINNIPVLSKHPPFAGIQDVLDLTKSVMPMVNVNRVLFVPVIALREILTSAALPLSVIAHRASSKAGEVTRQFQEPFVPE